MKSSFRLLALAALTSTSAFAVKIENCPKRIEVVYSDFRTNKTARDICADGYLDEKCDQVVQAFENLVKSIDLRHDLKLVKAAKAHCHYAAYATSDAEYPTVTAEIYTKGKKKPDRKDYLKIEDRRLGPGGIELWIYATIATMSSTELTLNAEREPGIALAIPRDSYDSYSAGGPLVFVGNAHLNAAALPLDLEEGRGER